MWREKHHLDIGIKITNKIRMSGSILKYKQNLRDMLFTKQYFSISLA